MGKRSSGGHGGAETWPPHENFDLFRTDYMLPTDFLRLLEPDEVKKPWRMPALEQIIGADGSGTPGLPKTCVPHARRAPCKAAAVKKARGQRTSDSKLISRRPNDALWPVRCAPGHR